ncbi:DUF1353 domain-containing protein [Methylobacterium currus]|uniref:DUF1353 domain-containing protein n=1 Tax=Methylobacterium currus TaxID=2051553 RepID=UPI002F266265
MLGASLAMGGSASSDELSEKKDFMQASLAAVKQNGQRLEPTSKLSFGMIPVVRPFVDWDYYYTMGPMYWLPNEGQPFRTVFIPKGFVTDLASVPRLLWSIFPKTGRYAYAAIVHDYVYWVQDRTRAEADGVLAAAMQDAKVPASTVTEFNLALGVAGSKAWNDNAAARAKGEKRILAKFPDDPLISWDEWRKRPDVFA